MHPLTNPLLLPFGHLLFILFSLLVYAVTTHITHTRRHPSAAFAWVLLLVLVPYVGLPVYLLVGLRKYVRPLPSNRGSSLDTNQAQASHAACWAIDTLDGLGLPPPQNNTSVIFHADGMHALRELDRVIASANHTLDICTYVFGNDAVAYHTARLLAQAVGRGVRVRLLIDAAGSWRTSRRTLRTLAEHGVDVRMFMPLIHNPMQGRINLRNHRKITVADGHLLWTGGRNIAQEYFLPHKHQPAWTDLTMTVEGALAHEAQQLFHASWRRHRGQSLRPHAAPAPIALHASPAPLPEPRQPAPQSSVPLLPGPTPSPLKRITRALGPIFGKLADADPEIPLVFPPATPPESDAQSHWAQLVPSGPDLADDTVLSLLLTGLYQARRCVWAITPYFVPDESLLDALRLAAIRGVEVNLILPRRSNHKLADIVRQQPLRDFAAAGGRIHLVEDMVHAKAVVIDDSLALVGSLNLDSRSLFLNFELMVALYSQQDIANLQAWIEALHAASTPYTPPAQTSLAHDIGEGLVRWLGFQI